MHLGIRYYNALWGLPLYTHILMLYLVLHVTITTYEYYRLTLLQVLQDIGCAT